MSSLPFSGSALAAEVDMKEVKRLAREPVGTIIEGSPVQIISDGDYWKMVNGSKHPAVVFFYVNDDQKSRNLATLIRYLAFDFEYKVSFFAYEVTDHKPIPKDVTKRLLDTYSLDQVPGSFFYDNDTGKMVLEQEDYQVPVLKEYRTPSQFFWKTWYKTVTKYINENIQD